MNNESIFEKVSALLIAHLGPSAKDAKMESDFHNDLGCDSLDDIEIIMAVEEEFNIEIADEDAAKFRTVGDMVSYLEKRAES